MQYLLILAISLFATVSYPTPLNTDASIPRNLHFYGSGGNTCVDLVASGCSGYRYYNGPSHPKYDSIMAILIAAEMAEKIGDPLRRM